MINLIGNLTKYIQTLRLWNKIQVMNKQEDNHLPLISMNGIRAANGWE